MSQFSKKVNPVRKLLSKRLPTERKFSYHLSKSKLQEKTLTEEEDSEKTEDELNPSKTNNRQLIRDRIPTERSFKFSLSDSILAPKVVLDHLNLTPRKVDSPKKTERDAANDVASPKQLPKDYISPKKPGNLSNKDVAKNATPKDVLKNLDLTPKKVDRSKQIAQDAASPRRSTRHVVSPKQLTKVVASPKQLTKVVASPKQLTKVVASPKQLKDVISPKQSAKEVDSPKRSKDVDNPRRSTRDVANDSPRRLTKVVASPKQPKDVDSPKRSKDVASPKRSAKEVDSSKRSAKEMDSPKRSKDVASPKRLKDVVSPKQSTKDVVTPRQQLARSVASPKLSTKDVASPRHSTRDVASDSPRRLTKVVASPKRSKDVVSPKQSAKDVVTPRQQLAKGVVSPKQLTKDVDSPKRSTKKVGRPRRSAEEVVTPRQQSEKGRASSKKAANPVVKNDGSLKRSRDLVTEDEDKEIEKLNVNSNKRSPRFKSLNVASPKKVKNTELESNSATRTTKRSVQRKLDFEPRKSSRNTSTPFSQEPKKRIARRIEDKFPTSESVSYSDKNLKKGESENVEIEENEESETEKDNVESSLRKNLESKNRKSAIKAKTTEERNILIDAENSDISDSSKKNESSSATTSPRKSISKEQRSLLFLSSGSRELSSAPMKNGESDLTNKILNISAPKHRSVLPPTYSKSSEMDPRISLIKNILKKPYITPKDFDSISGMDLRPQKRKHFEVPEEALQAWKKRKFFKPLTFDIEVGGRKLAAPRQPKPKPVNVMRTNQEPLKAFMLKYMHRNRMPTDITDLEIVFTTICDLFKSEMEETNDPDVLYLLENLQKSVLSDVKKTMSLVVEHGVLCKDIAKLQREVKSASKTLASITDEALKKKYEAEKSNVEKSKKKVSFPNTV